MYSQDIFSGAPYTHQKNLANKTMRWMIMDSKERFELHSQKYPEKMQSWENYDLLYNFNSHGFRSSEFIIDGCLFFGCSYTFGEGIQEKDRWTNIISTKLGLPCNNMGVNGAAGDTCFRLANYWIPKLTPKHVFILYPFKHRKEEFKNNKIYQMSPPPPPNKFDFLELIMKSDSFKNNYDVDLMKYYKNIWLASSENVEINFLKNILSLENICQKYNSKLTIISVDDIDNDLNQFDLARDLAHPGIQANKYIANLFLEKMD